MVGEGGGLPENNVVVQAIAGADVVAEQATIVDAAAPGGAGAWRVTLDINVAPGTQGVIRAFSPNPAAGGVVAESTIPVQYGEASQPTETPTPTDPDIAITNPVDGATISATQVTVQGTGTALPENNVIIHVIDSSGAIIAEESATADAPLGGTGPWSVTLDYAATPGDVGRITAFASSPADGTTMAESTINVRFQPQEPQPADISINIPLDGEEVSPVEVVVVGTGRSLPENNVVVQALDSRGRVLDEEATTVAADLGAEGEWRVTLAPGVNPGTNGRIYAFSTSPADGSIVAEDAVDVRYGRVNAEPRLSIGSPGNGATINTDSGFGVSGTGANLPEGNVVVEVRDSEGRRVAQRATTVDGNGNWSVNLYTGPLEGPGRIIAFSPSPADNSRMVEDRIDVNFVTNTTRPIPPSIVIERPQNGGIVNATSGFLVSGRAVGIFENNVIVQARDAYGQLLRQVVTTADQNGNWSASLVFLIANGTPGSVTAFSTSPADGSVVTNDTIRVTFASSCSVRNEWPVYVVQRGDTLFSIAQRTGSTVGELTVANCLSNPNIVTVGQRLHVPRLPDAGNVEVTPELTISLPEAGASLDVDDVIIVQGEAVGVLPGNIFLRALDADSNVIDNTRGVVASEPDENGMWTWQAELDPGNVISGTHGMIFAYSVSPLNGGVETSAVVPVVYGPPVSGSYLTIDAPLPYSMVATDGTLTVSGRGAALFEGNVVVRLVDNRDNVLLEQPTTLNAAEVGGAGEWTIDLEIDYVGRGRIEAYSDSPADGSIVASAGLDVYFGDPTLQESFAVITHPLPNEVYTYADRLISVAGITDGVFEEQVFVNVVDGLGNILFVIPVEVDPGSGFWSTSLDVQVPFDRDRTYAINVVAANPTQGAVFAGDRISVESRAPEAAVTGTLTYLQRIALPDDAVVTVQIQDVSRAGAAAIVIGEQIIDNPGQPPIPYVVEYDPDEIDERFTYAVSATITDGSGALLFRNTTVIPVITQGAPTSDVEILVDAMQ